MNTLRIVFIVLLFLPGTLLSQNKKSAKEKKQLFKDELDGKFDVSDFLLTKSGFLVVPSIITEPALGYGGLASVMFFHGSMADKGAFPAITSVMGGGTENGSWFAGALHMDSWNKDKIRYTGGFAKINMNLDFYGGGVTDIFTKNPVLINYDGWVLINDISFRLAESPFFVGTRWVYLDITNEFEFPVSFPGFDGLSFDANVSELGFSVAYDTRDFVITSSKGLRTEIDWHYSDEWIGADKQYYRLITTLTGYAALNPKTILATRYEGNFSFGDIPFYIKPFVDMRGVPLQKYSDNHSVLVETELRYKLKGRWYLIGFGGLGTAFSSADTFDEGNSAYSVGTGFRYLIARKLGIQMGIDFAKSNDDYAFKIVFGSGWR